MAGLKQEFSDDIVGQEQRDPVQHDGRDDLIHAAFRLQITGDRSPQAREHGPHDNGKRRMNPERKLQLDADKGGARHADDVLAFGADVEQACAEREGDRQPRQDQRRNFTNRFADAVWIADDLLNQGRVSQERVVTADQHDDRTDEKAEHDGRERNKRRVFNK